MPKLGRACPSRFPTSTNTLCAFHRPFLISKRNRAATYSILVARACSSSRAIVVAGALTLRSLRESCPVHSSPDNRPIQSSLGSYVTSNTCRSCHPGNYASWHASFHRTMTQVATTQNLLGDMEKARTSPLMGASSNSERGGNKFFIRARGAKAELWRGAADRLRHRIAQPPNSVDRRRARAGPSSNFRSATSRAKNLGTGERDFSDPARAEGILLDRRMERRLHGLPRHPGQSRFVNGNTWDSQVAEFGIACEACHSEGREHIARNHDPIRRFKMHLTRKSIRQ